MLRLYQKHELALRQSENKELDSDIARQVEYARDNMNALQKLLLEEPATNASNKNVAVSLFYNFMKRLIILGVFIGALNYTLKNFNLNDMFDGKFKIEIKTAKDIKTRLDDVKGMDEIKGEIKDIISMLQNPDKYRAKGAKLPKGILLFGDPGTGKTLLARAIAGESNVNFIFCSGSDFDEMYVGVGAKRVRQLFKEARLHSPCIIFIDEVDSLLAGSRRTAGEHSSSRGTINQILAEMDGFEKNDNIMVIGATNHEDSLDSAAVRPGRFDKKIHVPHPDKNGRAEIFQLYLDKIKKSPLVKAMKLAEMTPGFTGAEIENLVNVAITEAVHNGKPEADLNDFEFSRDRIMMGIERKNLSMSEKDRLATAIHEAGHALACYYNKHASKLYKATIVSRGGSLGATYMVPGDDTEQSRNKAQILAHIDVAMGGHVAEKLLIGSEKISSGCGSDL